MKKEKGSVFNLDISFGSTSLTNLSLFAQNLAVMLRAGMPISEALSVAMDTSSGRMRRTLKQIFTSVRSGRSLSDSFSEFPKVFPRLFVSATYAGEASGKLEENLQNLAGHLENERDMIGKIKSAMTYPLVVLVATFGLGLLLMYFILPKITPLFEGLNTELPATTMALLWLSEFIQQHGLVFMIALVGAVVGIVWVVRRPFAKPATHWLLVHLPVIRRITKGANLARFCRSLAALLESGLSIDEALDVTKQVASNHYYQKAIGAAVDSVRQGGKLSANLERFNGLFPLIVPRMLRVGEESGSMEETLRYLAGFYDNEVNNAVKAFTSTIEPALLLVIGAIVAFLGLSIITPMYEISGGIKR